MGQRVCEHREGDLVSLALRSCTQAPALKEYPNSHLILYFTFGLSLLDNISNSKTAQPRNRFELILAANYLDIKSLLDLTCAKVASMIKGKTPEEIRKQFNIGNDFSPEEEAQVREENKWCEDA